MLAWPRGWLYVPLITSAQAGGRRLGLYIHIPFCDHKCSYCDFNSYAGLDHLIPAYTDALVRETELWSSVASGWTVSTIFFGGGTPSLMPLPRLERVIDAVESRFNVDARAEVTLEANPGTVDASYLRVLRSLGVNRLSIGVQSLDDDELRDLDRIHDASQAVAAYRAARSAGFDNVNLDLIFGLRGQDLAGWQRNLERAVALGPEHLSLYALTVEPGTKLAHQVDRGHVPAPDPDLQADMYEAAGAVMAAAGYDQYEISNWSVFGRMCRHNLVYWRNEPYLGLGAGAHSSFLGRRFAVVTAPSAYVERVRTASGGHVVAGEELRDAFPQVVSEERVDGRTDASDTLVLGLRLNEGVDLEAFARRCGAGVDEVAGSALSELTGLGLLELGGGRLKLTERGRLVSNEVFVRLLPAELQLA
jgi:oxygen-independent coproporphyrinogen-3 oxidase